VHFAQIKSHRPVAAIENRLNKSMDLEIAGKTFIVTGGTDGLGLATAQVLLEEGANVLVSGRSSAKFTAMQASSKDAGDRIAYVQGDNADSALPDRLRSAVLERWGRLDGMLVSVGGPSATKALTTNDDAWRGAFESVFLGTVRLLRDLSPTISDGGAIVIVLAILRPGLALLAKSFAEELGPRAVRVNSLLPNLFATERMKSLIAEREPPVANIALKRIGNPAEFGRMATILLSPVSSYVTGASISIDGGQLKSL
jgi:3-oxoacyl-[acyl-carrier protein] reductase